jgi:hypothetical protein
LSPGNIFVGDDQVDLGRVRREALTQSILSLFTASMGGLFAE